MQINDKRKFNIDGDVVAIENIPDSTIQTEINKLIADVPRVYEDPKPMTNHVLVKQNAKETTYAGTRFLIPDSAQQSPNEGVVVAIGPDLELKDVPRETWPIIPGDLVTFGRFNAEPVTIGGEEFALVCFHDIKLRQKVTYAVASH